ncbi:MAG: tetratricopeptide repeat protein [Candidatus Omnitrophica bacterium]|nr:tetratricopeptide repeat protein [Candidatus Omnitrophota bacterium]
MKLIMRCAFIAIILIIPGTTFSRAETPDEIFNTANRNYDEDRFREASVLYESLISDGVKSGNLYYNLGNTYYKLGKKGKALVNYERAAKYIPNNEDLFANISFIRAATDFAPPLERQSLIYRVWTGVRDAFRLKTWFIFSVVFFSSVCLLMGAGSLSYGFQARSRVISGILLLFFMISLAAFIDGYNAKKYFREGIVTEPEAEVRYSPSFTGVVAFKLVEGMKAQILGKDGAWTHIRLSSQKSGWVESGAIEAI